MLKKIKAAFQRLIENIGEQNKSQYGGQGINCCDLNKKPNK